MTFRTRQKPFLVLDPKPLTVLFAFFGNCWAGSLGIDLCHTIDMTRVQVVVSLVGDSQSVSAASKQGLSLPAGVGS